MKLAEPLATCFLILTSCCAYAQTPQNPQRQDVQNQKDMMPSRSEQLDAQGAARGPRSRYERDLGPNSHYKHAAENAKLPDMFKKPSNSQNQQQ